jgi:hypothetical protein
MFRVLASQQVIDFSEEPAWIVIAVVQDNDPRG